MAHDDQEYADLPGWCRPGALVGLTTRPAGSSRDTARRVRVARITKTRVAYTFTVNGREIEDFVPRGRNLGRPAMTGRGGAQLYRLDDPAFRDALAVQEARNLEHKIERLFARRTGSSTMHADAAKPLQTRDDALDLLDEVAAAVAALRAKLAAEVEAEGI